MRQYLFEAISGWFATGIFTLLPLLLTFVIVRFVIQVLTGWLLPLSVFVPHCLTHIPHIEIFTAFFLIIVAGYIIQTFFLDRIISFFENIFLKKIPFVRQIYFGIKQIVHIFNRKKSQNNDQQVAWVRLPYKGIYCLGFMTGILDKEFSPTQDQLYYCFFVPHTPNPITGYYVIVSEHECVFTTITRQQAMSMIMSGGIILPEKNEHNK